MILNTKRIHNSFWMNFPARAKQMPSKILFVGEKRSALVNIRRKALLSSVGFRKRMTSRSPCGCRCLFRGLVLLFRSSLGWFNQEDAAASVWNGCFNVSPRSSLLAHQSIKKVLLSNPGGGTPIWNRRGCSSEILNLTSKGDQSGRGLSKFWPLKETA